MNKNNFISINEYLDTVNKELSNYESRIIGEVMEIQMYPTYLFFKIKDKEEGKPAVLTCIMWKSDYNLNGLDLKVGLEIIVSGKSSIYKPSGRFSLNVKTIELVGEGALKIAYDKLKVKLQKEGLFDEEKKRPIPLYPNKIGLITSKSGAVIADFSTNIGKFGYKISFIDSRVEGQLATEELLNSIRTFRDRDIDVLVIIRGGGSMESFLPFNNEILVREVATFPVPVLAGIGHEKDVSLLALAADIMVSTPTAVANALNESWERAESIVSLSEQSIFVKFKDSLQIDKDFIRDSLDVMKNKFQKIFSDFSLAQESLKIGVKTIKDQIIDIDRRIQGALVPVLRKINYSIANVRNNLSNDITRGVFRKFGDSKNKVDELLVSYQKQITNNDPKRQLKLGYSIVMRNGKILKTSSDLQEGDIVNVGLNEGSFDSEVKFINNN